MHQRRVLGTRWFDFVTNASVTSQTGFVGGDYRKRHQPTPHYAWLWTLAQTLNQTSGQSGSASEDDPAERGCSRSMTTLGSTPTTPGGSHTPQVLEGATTRGRSSVPLTDMTDCSCCAARVLGTTLQYTLQRSIKLEQLNLTRT